MNFLHVYQFTCKMSKVTRRKNVKEIIHPIFVKCSKLTDDPFWEEVFTKAAYGKMLKGFVYNNDTLIYRRGKKLTRREVPQNPEAALLTTMSFIREQAGIRSVNEEEIDDDESNQVIEEYNIEKKDLKKNYIQMKLIHDFAEQNTSSLKEYQDLISIINIGFALRYFTNASIHISNGYITSINGLTYDSDTNTFGFEPSDFNKAKSVKTKFVYRTNKEIFSRRYKPMKNHLPKIDYHKIWAKHTKNSTGLSETFEEESCSEAIIE